MTERQHRDAAIVAQNAAAESHRLAVYFRERGELGLARISQLNGRDAAARARRHLAYVHDPAGTRAREQAEMLDQNLALIDVLGRIA